MAGENVQDGYTGAATVTPSDTTVYSPPLRGIYVGGTGAVHVVTQDGQDVTFSAVPVGVTLRIAVSKIWADTAATLLVGLR